jgi:transcriptional regulator with XRE-family HTH domain
MPGRDDSNGRRPTIRDVAERAGVSKSLVSLVMRGEPMVRGDKRLRVQQAAEELGYRMNLAACSLPDVRSRTVGVLVADLRNPSLVDVVERTVHQPLTEHSDAARRAVRATGTRRSWTSAPRSAPRARRAAPRAP